MTPSIDGKIVPTNWPVLKIVSAAYERIATTLDADAWIVGRVSMAPSRADRAPARPRDRGRGAAPRRPRRGQPTGRGLRRRHRLHFGARPRHRARPGYRVPAP